MSTIPPGATEGRRSPPTAGSAGEPPPSDLSDIPLRELVQRLMATQEAFSALKADPLRRGGVIDDDRRAILKRQGALVRELRRRRDVQGRAGPPQRKPSAASPPPSW